jgi:hypothetical protein
MDKMNELREEFNQNKNQIHNCSRCKLKLADFECTSCSPFIYFCSNCDGYVHAMSSKRGHERKLITKAEEREEYPSYHKNYTNLESTYSSGFKRMESPERSNYDRHNFYEKYDYSCNTNYINELAILYDREKDELTQKNKTLENYNENLKLTMGDQVRSLQNTLDETIKKNTIHMKMLQDSHSLEIRKILNEKEDEIKFLRDRNRELERSNSELLYKIENGLNEVHLIKKSYNDQLDQKELERKKIELDINELKNFYEKRIKFLSESFAEEKTKLISNNDRNLEKLNLGYKESKEKYLALISQLEGDYRELMQNLKLVEE